MSSIEAWKKKVGWDKPMGDRMDDMFGNNHDSVPTFRDGDPRKKYFNEKNNRISSREKDTGMCQNYDQSIGICQAFDQSISFDQIGNIWIGYLILVIFCLLLSAIYAIFMSCKFSYLKYVVKWHIGIFFVNITIWFWVPCLIFNAICHLNFFCGYYLAAIPLAAVCLVISVLDLYFAPEAKYFKNQKQAEETSMFLERMKAAKPAIAVKIACFHYETRMRRNSNSTRTRTKEKVTFTERRMFPIDGFVDVSQVPSRIDKSGVTLFHFSKSITAGDAYSQDAFHQFKNRYVAANTHRDQAMHTSIELSVPGFIEAHTTPTDSSVRVMTVNGTPPWWANRCWFYALSCLNASLLLRIMFRTRSTNFSILIEKKYFVDPNNHRTYDFDTGLAGPPVVNNFIMSPHHGYGQPHQNPPGSYVPPQHFQPYTSPGGGGYMPAPPQFGQPGFAEPRKEKQPFISPKENEDIHPPSYNQHSNFTTIS